MYRTTDFRRQAVRAAVLIHDRLTGTGLRIPRTGPPLVTWDELCRTVSRFQLAADRGWRVAGERVLEDLDYQLRTLDRELCAMREQLTLPPSSQQVTRPREIVADLEALQDEFQSVELALRQQCVSVVTEPIVLDGTYLGAFRIVLRWSQIGLQKAYEVTATEPYAAEGDSDVTHPHVRNDSLCEGDGAAPIRAALTQGRLLDFFTLVNQVLRTYNPESAHVLLDRWDGVNCRDCGFRMPSDEHGLCERCDAPLCSDCSTCCGECDRYVCAGCSGECAECGSYLCHSCLVTPSGSHRQVCETCHSKPSKENHDCEEDEPADDPAPLPDEPAVGPATDTLHTLCLGEALVPA
jgi:hypothetical protein